MTAKILREQYEKSLKDLQNICPHTEVEVLPYYYAAGNFSADLCVCRVCDKLMDTKED